MNIQWYPGHMTKAKRAMQEDIKIIDIIIEITDARAPMATRNPDIDALGSHKGRIVILNKADLADDRISKRWIEYFESLGWAALTMDSRNRSSMNKLMKMIDEACAEKKERDKKRGILNRPVRAMVAGIPNVGKSTLINTIAGKSTAKTGNKPGVTKGNQWIKLNKQVELLDTPGILWPKFDDQHVGEMIAYIGSINDMIIDIRELGTELLNWLIINRPDVIKERYNYEGTDKHEALMHIAGERSCVKSGGEPDYDKAASIVVQEFRSGKLGKITLEEPPCVQE